MSCAKFGNLRFDIELSVFENQTKQWLFDRPESLKPCIYRQAWKIYASILIFHIIDKWRILQWYLQEKVHVLRFVLQRV